MKLRALLALWLCLGAAYAAPRTSANYEIAVESLGDGGRATSTDDVYVNDGNFSGIVGISTATTVAAKAGYAGQLFDVQSVVVSAPVSPATVIGTSDVQLQATVFLDDGTSFVAQAGDVVWSFTGAGLTGISADGVATAAAVSADTAATVMASVAGVTGTLALTALVATPDRLAAIAQMNQVSPGLFPGTGGLTVILLDTQGNAPGWRLAGESAWHASGETVSDLTAGFYTVEFESIGTPGHLLAAPPDAFTNVVAGVTSPRTYHYPAGAPGTLEVDLFYEPVGGGTGNVADQDKGHWRLLGETAWRDGATTASGLPAGQYFVEFTTVSGYQPVPTQAIAVAANDTTPARVTYRLVETLTGRPPQALDAALAGTQAPYEFVGQISSSVGSGSGTVVLARVVLTAAHVLFDDLTLAYATDVQWKGRRSGPYEPAPLSPLGSYLLDGYAAARRDVAAGSGDATSGEQDAAVLYFGEDAADGGSSGYLVSYPTREWLLEARGMTLAGYPLDTSHPEDPVVPGQIQATPVQLVNFTKQTDGDPDVYITRDIAGLAGMSGGPLCVTADDGRLYPAGVYLGGAGQCIVHGIGSEVQALIQNGDLASQGGPNHVGGGVIQVSSGLSAASLGQTLPATLTVRLNPGLPSGGGWRLSTEKPSVRHTDSSRTVTVSSGTVLFAPVIGYLPPPEYAFSLKPNENRTISASYGPLIARITTTALKIGAPTLPYVDKIAATNSPSDFTAQLIDPAGASYGTATSDDNPLHLVLDKLGNLKSLPSASDPGSADTIPSGALLGTYRLRVKAFNRYTAVPPANLPPGFHDFPLVIAAAQPISVSFDATLGDVYLGAVKLPAHPVLPALPTGSVVSLRAEPKSAQSLFSGWSGSGAKGVPTLGRVLSFTVGPQPVVLTAAFHDNVLGNSAGTFQGLLSADIDAFSGRGLLTVTLSPKGNCTVSLHVGSRVWSFKDTFKEVDFTLKKATLVHTIPGVRGAHNITVGLLLDASAAPLLHGMVTVDQVNYTSAAPLAVVHSVAGRYAVAFPHATASGLPGGDGFGTASVNTRGMVTFTGTLGDASPVSASAHVGPNGEWPFFALLYGKTNRGGLTGLLTISEAGTIGQSLEWYKPADAAAYYPNGFALSEVRQPPLAVNGRLLPLKAFASLPSTQTTVTITGGGLAPVPAPFAVMFDRLGNAIKTDGTSGPSQFSLRVNLANGLYSGKFKDSQSVIRAFSGIVLPAHDQSAAEGFGVFKGDTGQTGAVGFAHP